MTRSRRVAAIAVPAVDSHKQQGMTGTLTVK
jgi:hypothetical protein